MDSSVLFSDNAEEFAEPDIECVSLNRISLEGFPFYNAQGFQVILHMPLSGESVYEDEEFERYDLWGRCLTKTRKSNLVARGTSRGIIPLNKGIRLTGPRYEADWLNTADFARYIGKSSSAVVLLRKRFDSKNRWKIVQAGMHYEYRFVHHKSFGDDLLKLEDIRRVHGDKFVLRADKGRDV